MFFMARILPSARHRWAGVEMHPNGISHHLRRAVKPTRCRLPWIEANELRRRTMEWELDEAGNMKLPRLTEYSTVLVGGIVLACQLKVANSEAELETGGIPFQLAMTASQAFELGQALLLAAEQLVQASESAN